MARMDIVSVCDILTVARDNFKAKYNAFKAEFEETMRKAKENYKPGSEYYNIESEKAKSKFESSVLALREEVREFAKTNIDDLREDEIAEVKKIDTASMEKLRAVSDLPLSAAELEILQQRFAPNGEYWATREIASMAEKNGLNPMQYLNSATLDVKLDVLSQLEGQLEKMLSEYDGGVKYQTEVLLHDSVLLRAENVYTSGWKSVEMENADVARRAFVQLKSKSAVEQGIGLSNICRNATPEVKTAIFYEMIQDNMHTYDDALKFAGLLDEFNAFKSGDYDEYSKARSGIEKTMVATTIEEVANIANGLNENKYYNNMLKSAAEKNEHINDYLTDKQKADATVSE